MSGPEYRVVGRVREIQVRKLHQYLTPGLRVFLISVHIIEKCHPDKVRPQQTVVPPGPRHIVLSPRIGFIRIGRTTMIERPEILIEELDAVLRAGIHLIHICLLEGGNVHRPARNKPVDIRLMLLEYVPVPRILRDPLFCAVDPRTVGHETGVRELLCLGEAHGASCQNERGDQKKNSQGVANWGPRG